MLVKLKKCDIEHFSAIYFQTRPFFRSFRLPWKATPAKLILLVTYPRDFVHRLQSWRRDFKSNEKTKRCHRAVGLPQFRKKKIRIKSNWTSKENVAARRIEKRVAKSAGNNSLTSSNEKRKKLLYLRLSHMGTLPVLLHSSCGVPLFYFYITEIGFGSHGQKSLQFFPYPPLL